MINANSSVCWEKLHLTNEIHSSISIVFHSIKMKLFQSTQKYFMYIGITSYQSIKIHPILNARTLICICLLILNIITHAAYFIFLANNFEEHTNCVLTISTGFAIVILFASNIWNMKKIFETIENIEDLIQKSK